VHATDDDTTDGVPRRKEALELFDPGDDTTDSGSTDLDTAATHIITDTEETVKAIGLFILFLVSWMVAIPVLVEYCLVKQAKRA
jgi:hypothetical protein